MRVWDALLALCVLLMIGVGYIGYSASSTLMAPKRIVVSDRPANYGLSPSEVKLDSPRVGQPLAGWLFKHPDDHGRAILFIHGWGSSKKHMLRDYESWLARRYTVLAFDLAGHGDSPDAVTTLGAKETLDARAAADWLVAHGYKTLGVLGTSMGGAAAIDLAAGDLAVKAVVTDGAPADPADMPYLKFQRMGLPLAGFLGEVTTATLGLRTGVDIEGAAAVRHVGALAPRPLLIIHGDRDHVIPVGDASLLFAAAGAPKQLWIVPGADHMSEHDRAPHTLAKAAYEQRVEAVFDALK